MISNYCNYKTKFNIIAVIVTYNRKRMLLRCINAVVNQSVKLNDIFIVDNASTDGTFDFLKKKGVIENNGRMYEKKIKNITLHYFRLKTNSGGAGGFYNGMYMAWRKKPDYIWIMDDDGYPSESCLENQLKFTYEYDYIMPVSLDTEKHDVLTWYVRDKKRRWIKSYSELRASYNADIMNYAVPFNGLLLSQRIVRDVGFPKKDMFIWGDDFEHQCRCIKAGYRTVTSLDAVFFHPEDKADHHLIFFGRIPVNYTDSKLRFTCLIRNSTYNYWNYKGKYLILIKLLIYSWFFLINKKFALKEYFYYLNCVLDGIKGDFSRHKKFLG